MNSNSQRSRFWLVAIYGTCSLTKRDWHSSPLNRMIPSPSYRCKSSSRVLIAFRQLASAQLLICRIVWILLLVELLFEIFIRPDGYNSLIVSEKAFSPSTVRFINSFHLLVESLSLAAFIPEFLCLLTGTYTCGDRPAFSFFNAAYMSVLGMHQSDAFLGRAYIALVRLRVFGLVRHWKRMWIKNALTLGCWTSSSGGILSVLAPSRTAPANSDGVKNAVSNREQAGNSLTNASNIGTALLVTNSHRTLMIL